MGWIYNSPISVAVKPNNIIISELDSFVSLHSVLLDEMVNNFIVAINKVALCGNANDGIVQSV